MHICALLCLCSCLHGALQQCTWWLNSKLFIIWGQLHAASLKWKDQLHKSIHHQSQTEISAMLLHRIIRDYLHILFIWFIIIFALDMHEYALNSKLSCIPPRRHRLSEKISLHNTTQGERKSWCLEKRLIMIQFVKNHSTGKYSYVSLMYIMYFIYTQSPLA